MRNRKNYLKRRAKMRRLVNEGFAFETGRVCEVCGAELYDFPMYDALGCLACDSWAEDICGDADCPMCAKRPARPWGVLYDADAELGGHLAVWHAMLRKRSLQNNFFHKKNGAERRKKRLEYIKEYRKR